MTFKSALRAPYRSRTFVPSETTFRQLDGRRLYRAIVWTQLVLFSLCAARVGVDCRRGPLTIEADLALALLLVVAMSLAVKALARCRKSHASSRLMGRSVPLLLLQRPALGRKSDGRRSPSSRRPRR